VGDVLDEAKVITSDPGGYIRSTIINGAQDYIGDQLEQVGVLRVGLCNVAGANVATGRHRHMHQETQQAQSGLRLSH
jgi:hypothetical protein